MANNVADAKAAIYNRLASAPTFHPASARLFEDWTLQGGDIITVTSDSDSYSLPIYGMRMKWDGGTRVSVESSGNEKRDAIEKMAQKEVTRASNGYRSGVKRQGAINYHDERLIADGSILQQAGLQLNAEGALIYAETGDSIGAKFKVVSNAISAEVTARTSAVAGLSGRIDVQAGQIGLVVEGTGENAHIKPGQIVTAINNQEESIVYLSADKIKLDGNTTLSGMLTIDSGNLQVNGNVYAGLTGNNYFQGNKLRLVGGSSSQGADVAELAYADVSDMIIKAAISDDNLYLQLWKKGDSKTGTPSITFSRAITSWTGSGWSNGVYTAVADPQYQIPGGNGTHSTTLQALEGYGTISRTNHYVSREVRVLYGPDDEHLSYTGFHQAVSINADSVYNLGSSEVVLSDTLTWGTTPASGISVQQNSVTVSTSGRKNTSGTSDERTKTINLYSNATTSGLTATFYVTHTDSTDAKRIIKRTATCSDANLTAANIKNGSTIFGVTGSYTVNLNSTLSWGTAPASGISVNQNSVTVSTSGRVNSSGATDEDSRTINLYSSASTSGLTATFYVTHTNSTDGNRIIKRTATCSDSSLTAANIKAGSTIFGVTGTYTVNLSDTLTWTTTPGSGVTATSNAVTVSTSGRVNSAGTAEEATKKINLYTSGSASGLTVTVYVMHTNSTSANRIMRRRVTCSDSNLTEANIKHGVTIFGKTGTYDGSDLLETGSFTANGTYTPSSGKTGFSSVTVNVPSNWDQAYIAGWNAYYAQSWYIPTDNGSGGQFLLPSQADSTGAWSYQNWSRATDAYNAAKCTHTDKGAGWRCTITNGSSGYRTCKLELTFGPSQSVPFNDGGQYHLYV